jgi:maltodextrin utilization protein YvdJ
MLLFVISTFLPLAQADQADATTAIASAKEQILICYQAAKDSEEAGANITALVAVLNDAGTLLSRAEFAYSVSDFDTARDLAVQSRNSLNNFISEANTLKEATTQQQNQDFLINVVGSIIGTFAVIVAGFSAWLFLKKKNETGGTHTSESSSV